MLHPMRYEWEMDIAESSLKELRANNDRFAIRGAWFW